MSYKNTSNIQTHIEKGQMLKAFGVMNRLFVSYMSDQIKAMNITFSDSVFLMNIGLDGGISQDEIAKSLAIDKAAVTRSMKRMEKLELIRIIRSDKDKRVKHVYLTQQGQELFIQLNTININIVDGILAHMDDDEKSRFCRKIIETSQHAKEFYQSHA